jgi:hypothetical protein
MSANELPQGHELRDQVRRPSMKTEVQQLHGKSRFIPPSVLFDVRWKDLFRSYQFS